MRAKDKEVARKIIQDIYTLQWSVQNKETFHYVFDLLENLHMYAEKPDLNNAQNKFFLYMKNVRVISK